MTFSGRARRPEYWWFALFVLLGAILTGLLDAALFGTGTDSAPATRILQPLFQLAIFLPFLAVGWRRMHDTGRAGWLLLLPALFSVGFGLALSFGLLGFGFARGGTLPDAALAGPATMVIIGLILLASLVQILLMVLMLWWLTRPTQPGANAYGPEPRRGGVAP